MALPADLRPMAIVHRERKGRMTDDLFSQLRAATAAAHHRLDESIDICGDGLTIERYGCLLARFHGLFAAVEPQLAAVRGLDALALDLDLARCRRTAWLSEDLETIGRRPGCLFDLASSRYSSVVAAVPEALGCLYVIEGAGLGGQVIVPCVQRQLGLSAAHGCRFFAGHGAATGERWRRLRAGADDYARRTGTHARIVRSAVAVFAMFEDWFSEDVNGNRGERPALVGGTVQH
jgi:heme oxygenase